MNLKNQNGNSNFIVPDKRLLPQNEIEFGEGNIKNGEHGVWSALPSELYVIGDIHGRTIWKDIVNQEKEFDKFSLGNFVVKIFEIFDLEKAWVINFIRTSRLSNVVTFFLK